jgi:4-hydroxybenzoate polyprenyltransferase
MQLTRLPNVFTAMADVFAGFLLTHSTLQPADEVAALVVASAGLYTAGMVLNDLFDLEVDRRLRPDRPLASGRITRAEATGLAIGLVIAAIAAALTAGTRTAVLAVFLLVSVVIYNGLVKASWAGPVVMGMCRLLNVLLGASTAAPDQPALKGMAPAFLLAAGMGTYIIGVTWFARREAEQSKRSSLIAAMVVVNLGLLIVALLATNPQAENVEAFWVVLAVPAVLVNRRLLQATANPSPGPVQTAIKTAILALVILDASAVLLVRGPLWSLAVLALLVPTLLLGRWVYST